LASTEQDLNDAVVDIALSHLRNLREILFVVGQEKKLIEFNYAELVRFSEPEAVAPFLLKQWKFMMEHIALFKGCIVRFVEAKIVSDRQWR